MAPPRALGRAGCDQLLGPNGPRNALLQCWQWVTAPRARRSDKTNSHTSTPCKAARGGPAASRTSARQPRQGTRRGACCRGAAPTSGAGRAGPARPWQSGAHGSAQPWRCDATQAPRTWAPREQATKRSAPYWTAKSAACSNGNGSRHERARGDAGVLTTVDTAEQTVSEKP